LGQQHYNLFIDTFSHETFDEAYRSSKGNVYDKVEEVINVVCFPL
jgi:hypothetical protein